MIKKGVNTMNKNELCIACNNKLNSDPIIIKEQMNGTNEEFKYLLCKKCGTLTISKVPPNLGKY